MRRSREDFTLKSMVPNVFKQRMLMFKSTPHPAKHFKTFLIRQLAKLLVMFFQECHILKQEITKSQR